MKSLGARADSINHYTVGVAAWDIAYRDQELADQLEEEGQGGGAPPSPPRENDSPPRGAARVMAPRNPQEESGRLSDAAQTLCDVMEAIARDNDGDSVEAKDRVAELLESDELAQALEGQQQPPETLSPSKTPPAEMIAGVLDVLRERGLLDETLIVFTGDNGAALPHGKGSLYDPGSNVPLIVRWPGVVKAAGESKTLLSGEDIAPTLLEAAGLPPHPRMTGVSFLPLLKGELYTPRQHVFTERDVVGEGARRVPHDNRLWKAPACAAPAPKKSH